MVNSNNIFEYEFPIINSIDDVLPVIAGRSEFIIKHDVAGGYKTVNYLVNFEDTFPVVQSREDAILRELRGITFDAASGKIIQRKLHKFFNILERVETRIENVDITKSHIILEKLDGSMAVPIHVGDPLNINWETLRWTTKMGLTDIAKQIDRFASINSQYNRWSAMCIASGYTPIFEWMSRQQRIVIDHPIDRLVLIAVRNNITGQYHSYSELKKAELSDIEVVNALPGSVDNMNEFINKTRNLDNTEGYVIAFDSGHRVKIKTDFYVQLHKTLDGLRHEKDVIRMILDERLDDAKGFIPVDLAAACDAFGAQIYKNIRTAAVDIYWEAQASFDKFNGSKKRFALEVANGHKFSPFLFKMYDNLDEGEDYMYKYLIDHVRMNTSSQTKVNGVRHIIGDKTWNDYVTLGEKDE